MKQYNSKFVLCIALLLFAFNSLGQTSWTGASSTRWYDADNWTNGVPTLTEDAIIGDANFRGLNQPTSSGRLARCKSLTIGKGTISSTLTLASNLIIAEDLVIGSNGTINHIKNNRNINISGDWYNSGNFSSMGSNTAVIFEGNNQSIYDTTTFNNLIINPTSTLTLNADITIEGEIQIDGTLNPQASYAVEGSGNLTVNSDGVLLVMAENFTTNYPIGGTITFEENSNVEYASTIISQNISADHTYCNLIISGGTTKYLTANLPSLYASNGYGRISIEEGTLDMQTYTADRGASEGGSFTIANGAILKIGGANGFPSNYNNLNIATNSTVYYYGNNQTVLNTNYGNLVFQSSSGDVVKTMPTELFSVMGDFYSEAGSGKSVTFTAGGNINFYGDVYLDASSTFNASTYNINFSGDIINNGVINGNTSTFNFVGSNCIIAGSGSYKINNLYSYITGTTATDSTDIEITGNLIVDGGSFTHTDGGTITMSGSSKEIKGNFIYLSDLTVSGSVKGDGNIEVSGDFTVNGTYESARDCYFDMTGQSKAIAGSGDITFYNLNIRGDITTGIDFTFEHYFNVEANGVFKATSGTIFIDGSGSFSGEAGFYNLNTLASGSLTIGSNSIVGISNELVVNGSLDASSNTPNTFNYNGSGAQNIEDVIYNNLTLSNSGIKTPTGNFTVKKDLTIESGVTLNAKAHAITIEEDFINSGTFTAGTSTIKFEGEKTSTITGKTTFNKLSINKKTNKTWVNLTDGITVHNIDLSSGNLNTQNDTITITGTRTNDGVIIGTIIRTHTFSNATAYYFEGPNNYIEFSNPEGIDYVIVNVKREFVTDFDLYQECLKRKYTISIPNGTYSNADFRFHYEQEEVNLFIEPELVLYRRNSSTSAWDSIGANSRDIEKNFVVKNSVSDITGEWIASGIRNIVRWNGSESTDWNTASNWTTISGSDMKNRIPGATDVAQIGYDTYANEPALSASTTIGALRLGDYQEATLHINSNTLTVEGDIRGIWTSNAHHTINVGAGTIDVETSISLSDDTLGHYLTFNIGTGSLIAEYDVHFNHYGEINFTDAGLLKIGRNLTYSSGTFNAGIGTVEYTGALPQVIAPLTYNNLTLSKTGGRATVDSKTIVEGNLSLNTGGALELNDTLGVYGNVTIGPETEIATNNTYICVQGNWVNNGTFNPRDGVLCFFGGNNQTVSATPANTFRVYKSGGTLTSVGDISIKSDLIVLSGTWDLDTYTANRDSYGGSFTMEGDGYIKIGGQNNFPKNFNTIELNTLSTVEYNGTIAQYIDSVGYGNIIFSNGETNEKILTGDLKTNGNFTINTGATLEPGLNIIEILGNFSNNGTFIPSTSTLLLSGNTKTFSGATTLYNLSASTGSYTFSNGPLQIEGDLTVDAEANINFSDVSISLDGNFTNKGSVTSNGTVTFTGKQIQTVRLLSAIKSSSTGVINFNGTVAPVFSSISSPSFSTVNINNTAGIAPSVPWTVYLALNIGAGSKFNTGSLAHSFYGNFVNNGTFTSSGRIKFIPTAPFSARATIALDGVNFTSDGIVEFGGSVPLNIKYNNPTFKHIDITNTNASGVTFSKGLNISGDLNIRNGATLKGGTKQTITISGNYDNSGTFSGESSTMVFQGAPSTISGNGNCNYHNLTIGAGAELELHKSINIAGDFVNKNTFTPGGYSVCFNGPTTSSVESTSGHLVFDELQIDKASDSLKLNVPVIINSHLELTSGVIAPTRSNLLTIVDDATVSSGNATSYIAGPVKKIGDDAFVFPLGGNKQLAKLGISAPVNATDAFTAEYFPTGYSNTVNLTAPIYNVSTNEYWTLDRTAGSSNIKVTLYWDTESSNITDLSDLTVAHYNGLSWVDQTQDGGTTGTTTSGSVTSQAVTSFGSFTFGSKTSGKNHLPVEYHSFYTTENQGVVEIEWVTSSEKENDYFEVQKSLDNRNFQSLGTVYGSGTTSRNSYYSYTDNSPAKGVNYYRLKQVDMDGNYSYSLIKEVTILSPSTSAIMVYPNPARIGDRLSIKIKGLISDNFSLTMLNAEGQEIRAYQSESLNIENNILSISTDELGITVPGQYIIIIGDDLNRYNKRIIVK
jgi:fibronectin-binding autotransporter adhesin